MNDTKHSVLLILPLLLLSACQLGGQKNVAPSPQVVATNEQPAPKLYTGNSHQDVIAATNALHQGRTADAKIILEYVLNQKPDNYLANKLLKQINTNPVALLGETYFIHQIKSGESLSKLAKQYLNDQYMFFALARYNNIANPGRIKVGDKIKIPGEAPSITEIASSDTTDNLDDEEATSEIEALAETNIAEISEPIVSNDVEIAEQFERQNYHEVLLRATQIELSPFDQDLVKEAALALSKEADEEGAPARGLEILSNIGVLLDDPQSLQPRINELNQHLQAKQTLADIDVSERPANLYESLLTVKRQYPQLATTSKYQMLQSKLSEDYHTQAMLALRQQQLDSAIALWDKVLTLDSKHELAIIHLDRAKSLKQKLQSLE
ncbi:LysM domain-containing protein [Thalassotalea euphylliae]|uniref:LysM domain-containing protein n=1 Tax=Thalassotalea euphylliae TaxID=1655234 RepID=A0A3E0TQD7_9GAMM|nr:LysM domain-containing protein [Thalassotalea euphylliae]REL26708.1 LysM domain-containing protein [Thalassotalea euphylliae]